jgi:hypothetical protein
LNKHRRAVRALLLPMTVLVAAAAIAAEESPPASEWRSYCTAYLAALDGDKDASDLDITYCVGVTKGLLSGMQVGSQLGALGFGSRLAIRYELDPDEVFQLFQQEGPTTLLAICSPPSHSTKEFVRTTLAHLDRHPESASRPIAEVMYEALRDAYPCP